MAQTLPCDPDINDQQYGYDQEQGRGGRFDEDCQSESEPCNQGR